MFKIATEPSYWAVNWVIPINQGFWGLSVCVYLNIFKILFVYIKTWFADFGFED